MKISLSAIALLTFYSSFAQVQNYTYTDCDGFSESVYDILGQGKPLLIVSAGLDCSICMGQAPDVKAFADAHPEVRVWGAMNYRYSTNLPTCTGVNNWESTYSWQSIFMFPDVNDDWQGLSYPSYYVISPVDSLIQYQGASFSLASIFALDLVSTGISPLNNSDRTFHYNAASNTLQITASAQENKLQFFLFNALGQMIIHTEILPEQTPIVIALSENMPAGIYFPTIQSQNGKIFSSKIVVKAD